MAEPATSHAEQIAHLEELIATLRRRQRVLESQRARFGDGAVPSQIVLELEDIARDLTLHTADLRRLRPSPADHHNPYLGLLTFHEADADRFFGRDALVADLVEHAAKITFLAVLGASGSGKSSVVRAGLVPMLKGGALPGSDRWRYVTLRPGARPLDALAAELARLQGDPILAARYRNALGDGNRALLMIAEAVLDRATGQRLVSVVDQAEELWTNAPADERARFVDLLLTATGAPDTSLLAALAIRADFLHRAAEHSALATAIADNDIIVSPMLEYTLQSLWERRDGAVLTRAAFRTLGGIEGALVARADTILEKRYTAEQREQLRQLLPRLVQPGEGAEDTRRRVALSWLVPAHASLAELQTLLQPLTEERLLVVTTPLTQPGGPNGDPAVGSSSSVVEVSHEALIRAWPRLSGWINDARDDLRFQLQLEDAAREWQAHEEDPDYLWSGVRLAQADSWLERAQTPLIARDEAFVDASRAAVLAREEAAEAARRRDITRLRIFLAVGGVLLLMALAFLVFALFQQGAASREAEQANMARTTAERQTRIAQSQARGRVAFRSDQRRS